MSSRLELCTQENGREVSEMDLENRYGQTLPSTWESGERTEPMERVDLFMLTEISTMDTGQTTKQMEWEHTNM